MNVPSAHAAPRAPMAFLEYAASRNREPCDAEYPQHHWAKVRSNVERARLFGAPDAVVCAAVEIAVAAFACEQLGSYTRSTLMLAALSVADKFHRGLAAQLTPCNAEIEFKLLRAVGYDVNRLTPYTVLAHHFERQAFTINERALALSMLYAAIESEGYVLFDPLMLGLCLVAVTLVHARNQKVKLRLDPKRTAVCVRFLADERRRGVGNHLQPPKKRALEALLPSACDVLDKVVFAA